MISRNILKSAFAFCITCAAASVQAQCPVLPNQIANGDLADATKVMSDMEHLRGCLNAGQLVVPPVASLVVNGPTSAVTIRNPSASIPYDFNLPAGIGMAGQVLTSAGSGQPLVWTSPTAMFRAPITDGYPVGRPSLSSLSWTNQGTATAIDHSNGPITMFVPNQGSSQVRALGVSPLSTPYTLTVKLSWRMWTSGGASAGIYAMDTAGKLLKLEYGATSSNLSFNHASSVSSGNSNVNYNSEQAMTTSWMRLSNDGITWRMFESADGANWSLAYSEPVTSYLLPGIASVGVFADHNSPYVRSTMISIWSFRMESGSGTNSAW